MLVASGARRFAEIDLHIGSDGETLVVGHLLAAIPGQGAAQLLRQFAHMFRERADHGCGVPARDLEKHHKAGMALDERRDVRVVRPGEKIPFPVTWHGAVLSLGRPFADGDSIDDLSQSALGVAALGLAHLPRRPQMRHQLTSHLRTKPGCFRSFSRPTMPSPRRRAALGWDSLYPSASLRCTGAESG
jgi:hypothetical protein